MNTVTKLIYVRLIFILALYFAGGAMVRAQNQPQVKYVVFHKPGPNWKPGIDFREQSGVGEHVQHYAKLFQSGGLALGGPFLDNSGGMMVPAPGISLEQIKELAKSDPAVKNGLLVFEIKPWMIAMEKVK